MKTPDLTLPCLSIRQPWAWAILNAGKTVENRCWQTKFRGRFLIHAAKGCTRDEYDAAMDFMAMRCGVRGSPGLLSLPRGGIVGAATLAECVSESSSPLFVGEFGFVLKDVQPVEFYPCRGALGFFYAQ